MANSRKPAATRWSQCRRRNRKPFPRPLLIDTATGQSWILYHETGRAIEWIPLPFSAGKDRPSPFLPPRPDQVDGSR